MTFCENIDLQKKIKKRREQGATINEIAAEFPEYSYVTYKRFLKGTGRYCSREKMSKACKQAWVDKSVSEKNKHIEHLRVLAQTQRGKPLELSSEHVNKIKLWTSSEKNKERVVEQNKQRKKYTEDAILKTLNENNVGFVGDLSDSDNTITIVYPDGQTRRAQIKKFMKTGVIESPRDMVKTKQRHAIMRRTDMGVTHEMIDSKTAKMSYKGCSWVQVFANMNTTLVNVARIDKGFCLQNLLKEGHSVTRACKMIGLSPVTYARHFKQTNCSIEAVRTIRNFECLLSVDGEDVIYNRQLPGYSIRPDLRIERKKLIIEIDGPYTHSDEFKTKKYHNDRFHVYKKEGYSLLAFITNEIVEKRAIVDSMINNKLGHSKRIFARKCSIENIDTKEACSFFEDNHLMGSGSGQTLALMHNGEVACALRFAVYKGEIHVSRFCNRMGYTVIGGYTRLLSKLPVGLRIVNFVDARHGDGVHLLRQGFQLVSEHIGMWWTDQNRLINRRRFLGNSGYDHGYKKYWDYGQFKYVKEPVFP